MDAGWITEDMWNNPDKEGYLTKLSTCDNESYVINKTSGGTAFSKKKTKEKLMYFRLKGQSLLYFDNDNGVRGLSRSST